MSVGCVFESQTDNALITACSNSEIANNGFVPSEFCPSCPWYIAVGSERPTPVVKLSKTPCLSCDDAKNKIEPTQFVWPYWHGGATGDELRFSIRSVETNFVGQAIITVVGDKPPWYTGHFIARPRVSPATNNIAFRDMLEKMLFIATHDEIKNQFVWIMDDVYLIRQVNLCDLKDPRAERFKESTLNKWQQIKIKTMESLAERGLTQHDYATHLPHVVEKQKLSEVFELFELQKHVMLWEVLYGNMHRRDPVRVRPFLARIHNPSTLEQITQASRGACVLNHCELAWNEHMREFLLDRFPKQAASETGITPAMFFQNPNRKRVVKRRPPETHRGYVKAEQ